MSNFKIGDVVRLRGDVTFRKLLECGETIAFGDGLRQASHSATVRACARQMRGNAGAWEGYVRWSR